LEFGHGLAECFGFVVRPSLATILVVGDGEFLHSLDELVKALFKAAELNFFQVSVGADLSGFGNDRNLGAVNGHSGFLCTGGICGVLKQAEHQGESMHVFGPPICLKSCTGLQCTRISFWLQSDFY